MCYNSAARNHCIVSDMDAGHDAGARANPDIVSDDDLAAKLENMKADMEKGVAEKDEAMQAKVAEL